MSRLRMLATLIVGALAATVVSIAPAHAATDWRTRLTYQDGRGGLRRPEDRWHGDRVLQDEQPSGRAEAQGAHLQRQGGRQAGPHAQLTQFAGAGEISNVASYDGLKADDLFFVEVIERFDEGAGIVKTSAEPFLVSAQAPCTQ